LKWTIPKWAIPFADVEALLDLLILKKNLGPGADAAAAYRGTERARPVHFRNLPDTHMANQLFFWFLEEGGERGVVHDLKRAKQLAGLLNLFGDSVFFEVVQVGTERATTPGRGGFLGFDVSAGFNNSVIRGFVLHDPGGSVPNTPSVDDGPAGELSSLHRRFFLPKLNDHRIFQHYDDADFCLRTARALNTLRPGLIEGTDLSEYAVTSVYKVI
jgi:hypothetical protein